MTHASYVRLTNSPYSGSADSAVPSRPTEGAREASPARTLLKPSGPRGGAREANRVGREAPVATDDLTSDLRVIASSSGFARDQGP